VSDFASRLIGWQRRHGRHGLPWQGADAYGIWISEIMLQQTQVATVIPYYRRFLATFPNVAVLARASEDDVLALWSGLGYYARGRNLHRAAQQILAQHRGQFPRDYDAILVLPGIGRSTAAAVCALAFHERRAILDGNVKRVLARHRGIAGWPGNPKVEMQLWQQAEVLLPETDVAIYTQALMDMGATVCTRHRTDCTHCPVREDCVALAENRVNELPGSRPRKPLPEKHATFLLLLDNNELLLEKRPGSGIWGGLWCPPQLEDDSAGVSDYAARNGIDLDLCDLSELAVMTHSFTHFKLHITPLLLRLGRKPQRIEQPGRVWLALDDIDAAAIPAPVRSLLPQIKNAR
jgi:A/G-specific adenine glycosylase